MQTMDEWMHADGAMMRLTVTVLVQTDDRPASVVEALEAAARALAGKPGVVSLEIKQEFKGADLPY